MKSILIVDDDPASLALVEGVLEAEGYETRKAAGPMQALEILKTWTPDAILLDIQLHGLDNGLEFARRLKANLATRATPIVAFTAYGERWSEAETRAAGCDGFLEKPITAQMLAATVRKAVDKTR
jgi:two-component system, cell cycle response regulator DivK